MGRVSKPLESMGAQFVMRSGARLPLAVTGGAPPMKSVTRVAFWGAMAMALTAAVGSLFGVAA